MGKKKFIIISAPRTGSTLLRTCLDKLEDVICHGEVLGINRIMGISHKLPSINNQELLNIRKNDDIAFLSSIDFYNENITSGFKVLYYQLFHRQTSGVMDLLLKDKNVKIIHLWRNDLEKRFYSEVILNCQVKAKRQDLKSMVYNCDEKEVYRDAELTIRAANVINDIFKGHDVLNISYESFIKHEKVRENIVNFLELDPEQNTILIPEKRISFDHPVDIIFDNKDLALNYYRDSSKNLPALDFDLD